MLIIFRRISWSIIIIVLIVPFPLLLHFKYFWPAPIAVATGFCSFLAFTALLGVLLTVEEKFQALKSKRKEITNVKL